MEINTVEVQEDGSYKINDTISVPDDMANRHRRKLQVWLDAGNTPTPYVAPVPSWEDQMAESDRTMIPRYLEDHITSDHGGVAGNASLQAKYDAKVALRNSKPA